MVDYSTLNFEQDYTCPDCGAGFPAEELIYNLSGRTIFVCKHCGCIQSTTAITNQLTNKED